MKRLIERAALPTPKKSAKVRNWAATGALIASTVAAVFPASIPVTGPIIGILTLLAGKKQTDIHIEDMLPKEFTKLRNRLQRKKDVEGLSSVEYDDLEALNDKYNRTYNIKR
jgi:hypothetical protein